MTQSQIDKLGERLRVEHRDEGMVRLLDALYDNYESAATRIGAILLEFIAAHGFEEEPIFARRPTKSIQSIVAKLNRERTRLSKMQDIVGCRIIVQNRAEQSVLRGGLNQADVWSQLDIAKGAVRSRGPLGKTSVVDRNLKPSNGYRAVHVIASDFGAPYEIQIRTALQNRWAQLCERLDDKFPGLKYGQGPAYWRKALADLSDRTAAIESERLREEDSLPDYPEEMDNRWSLRRRDRIDEAFRELHALYDTIEQEV